MRFHILVTASYPNLKVRSFIPIIFINNNSFSNHVVKKETICTVKRFNIKLHSGRLTEVVCNCRQFFQ